MERYYILNDNDIIVGTTTDINCIIDGHQIFDNAHLDTESSVWEGTIRQLNAIHLNHHLLDEHKVNNLTANCEEVDIWGEPKHWAE